MSSSRCDERLTPQRPVLRMARVHEVEHAPFLGLNRAQAAVIEGAVLVSRLHMLPPEQGRQPRWPTCRSRSTRPPAEERDLQVRHLGIDLGHRQHVQPTDQHGALDDRVLSAGPGP